MRKILTIAVVAAALAGCEGHRGTIPLPPRTSTPDKAPPAKSAVPPGHVTSGVKVPPGHMPPPGKCRIWYPNTPPGRQGPIGECADLQHRVPPGAVLVKG